MITIKNPILTGFNPDPSICRVGDDYYIATSTFEWFPGVQIHHSTDLVHWELVAHPLNRVSQLDMLGVPDSGGIWAPCLSFCDDTFYLIYTNVLNEGHIKDTPNYLVTTKDILGDWSEPIYLNSSGFDPSLFHDEDGRKWLVNMKWDTLIGRNRFAGHLLQEYDPHQKKLVGPIINISKGTSLGCTEGPHLYKRNGYYYLMVAEGGTSYEHAESLLRSENLFGPYETHPYNPLITAVNTDMHKNLQKAGHASLVQGPNDEWFIVHLCGRPLPDTNRCILGRETSVQKVEWREDDWLYLVSPDKNHPAWEVALEVKAKSIDDSNSSCIMHDDFDTPNLNIHFQSLRVPATNFMSLTDRPGYLRLYGRESMYSRFTQSFIARRQQDFSYTAETYVEFDPTSTQQMAGLICYYNTLNFYYLRITFDEETKEKYLGILASINNSLDESMLQDENIVLPNNCPIYLKVVVDYSDLQFYYAIEKDLWMPIGKTYNASTLSDDATVGSAFTGAFVGMTCQDLTGLRHHADFDYFLYTHL